jgi:hypothetical protein
MGEVSEMRKFVAVAILGGALALGTGAAFASDNVDFRPPYQPMQSVSTASQDGSDQSMVAGGNSTGSGPYEQLRDNNTGQ